MRVRASGLILFIGNILSFLLGFIFATLIARGLTSEDLGIWFFLGSVITYFKIFEKILPYWSSRDIPRGWRIAKTCLIFSFLISIPPMIVFLALSGLFASLIGSSQMIFLLGGLFIPIYYVTASLTSIIFSREPHKLGPKNILIDGVKIPLALIMLRYGLIGVLTSVIIANLAFIAYGLLVSRKFFESKVDLRWVRMRIKQAWLPLHESALGYISSASDLFILGVLSSPIQLSFYGIAMTISRTLNSLTSLTSAIYPKVLGKGSITNRETEELFRFHYIFATPMLIGGVVLAPNLINIFGSKYLEGLPMLYLLLLSTFIGLISLLIKNIVLGLEKIDSEIKVGFKKLLRSKLFKIQAVSYVTITILILASLITIAYFGGVGVAISRLIASIVGLLAYLYLAKGALRIKSVLTGLPQSLLASFIMALILRLLNPVGSLMTLFSIPFGAIIYFIILMAIDKRVRLIVKIFSKEVMSRILYQLE